jgi:hypothetical protein
MNNQGHHGSHWSTVALGTGAFALVVMAVVVDDALSAPTWWVGYILVAMVWYYVRHRTRSVATGTAANLDERELATRNVGAWWGQMVMLALGAGTTVTMVVVSRLDGVPAELILQKGGGIAFSLFVFGAAVPTLVVASVLHAHDHDDDDDDYESMEDQHLPTSYQEAPK